MTWQEVLIDVRAGIQQSGNRNHQSFRLDVAQPLFVRELFRRLRHGLVRHRPKINYADWFNTAGLNFIQRSNPLGLRLAFPMHFAETSLPIPAIMLLLPAFIVFEAEQHMIAIRMTCGDYERLESPQRFAFARAYSKISRSFRAR